MSKMSELSQVLDDLICCGEQLIRTANAMKECFTEAAESTVKPKRKPKLPNRRCVPTPRKRSEPSLLPKQRKPADSSRHR